MRTGRPYKQQLPRGQSVESLYESYVKEYERQAQQFMREHGVNVTLDEARTVVMYDKYGIMNPNEFRSMYQAELNEKRTLIAEEKKLKRPGNIIRSIVSTQRYKVSGREAKRINIFFRQAEEFEIEEARKTYEGNALKKELADIRAKYKKERAKHWRYEGVNKDVLSVVNRRLKAEGITDSYERRTIIGNQFFARDNEQFEYIRDVD